MPRNKSGQDQSELIKLAIAGLDAQIRELQNKRAELASLAGGNARAAAAAPAAAPSAAPTGRKRVFSAATRKKLKLAAKRRWARERAESKEAPKAGKAAKAPKTE